MTRSRRRFGSLFAIAIALLPVACGGAAKPAAVPSSAASGPADLCGGDGAWLTAVVGSPPSKSGLERLDLVSRDPRVQHAFDSGRAEHGIDGDGGYFRNVPWSSEEVYEWLEGGRRVGRVVVARNVEGRDPRTLGSVGHEPTFTTPRVLPSGVREYPPNPAADAGYEPDESPSLFAFSDGTWIVVSGWMASRFRAVFERTSVAPPLPATPADVFVEYCFPRVSAALTDRERLDGSKTNGLTIAGDHMSMRWIMTKDAPLHTELLYTFATPELALRAESEQRARCATARCRVKSSAVEGRIVRYVLDGG